MENSLSTTDDALLMDRTNSAPLVDLTNAAGFNQQLSEGLVDLYSAWENVNWEQSKDLIDLSNTPCEDVSQEQSKDMIDLTYTTNNGNLGTSKSPRKHKIDVIAISSPISSSSPAKVPKLSGENSFDYKHNFSNNKINNVIGELKNTCNIPITSDCTATTSKLSSNFIHSQKKDQWPVHNSINDSCTTKFTNELSENLNENTISNNKELTRNNFFRETLTTDGCNMGKNQRTVNHMTSVPTLKTHLYCNLTSNHGDNSSFNPFFGGAPTTDINRSNNIVKTSQSTANQPLVPSGKSSKHKNCTITSSVDEYSSFNLNMKVPVLGQAPDGCDVGNNSNKRNYTDNLRDKAIKTAASSEVIVHNHTECLTGLPEFCSPLIDMFPDIDIEFIKQYTDLNCTLDEIIDVIMAMNDGYPKCHKCLPPLHINKVPVYDSAPFPPRTSTTSNIATSEQITKTVSVPETSGFDFTLPKSEATLLSNKSNTNYQICYDGESSSKNLQTETKEPSNFELLQEILPDADPECLREKSKLNKDEIRNFINEALEANNYPKIIKLKPMNEKKEEEDIELYSSDFDMEKFLKIFPEPFDFFKRPNRICQKNEHAAAFLKRRYRHLYIKTINDEYKKNNYNLTLTCEALDKIYKKEMNSNRPLSAACIPESLNLQFLKEACFIQHQADIKSHIERIEAMKKAAYDLAKEREELIECGCCYDKVLFENCGACNEGDLFCQSCIEQSAKVRIGDGMTTFPCLSDCGSNFSMQTLQNLLDAHMFSKLLQRIQMEEVKSAEIEGLEMCPFCEFASIPPPETKIFTCLNPDCLKESCRQCHKVSHIPLRCEEVENDDQAKARKYIEDEMTKALVRECYKCKKSFIKMDGCNKMTCTCGAKMCYICRQPVKDYQHFNGPGGSADIKCPLYSSDNVLHVEAIKEMAQKALETVASTNPDLKLKYDPSKLLPTSSKTNSKVPNGVVENPQILIERIHAWAHHGNQDARVQPMVQLAPNQLPRNNVLQGNQVRIAQPIAGPFMPIQRRKIMQGNQIPRAQPPLMLSPIHPLPLEARQRGVMQRRFHDAMEGLSEEEMTQLANQINAHHVLPRDHQYQP